MSDEERAREVVDAMFVNGAGQSATRLVLTDDDSGRDLGGWCREALYDKVAAALADERDRCQHACVTEPPASLEPDPDKAYCAAYRDGWQDAQGSSAAAIRALGDDK